MEQISFQLPILRRNARLGAGQKERSAVSDYHVNKFARLHCHLRDQVEKHQFLNALQVVGEMNLMLIGALNDSLKDRLEGWDHAASWFDGWNYVNKTKSG